MTEEIFFVRTRWEYQSYTDFWKLVQLSQFPTIYTDEVDISKSGVYIVCPQNGEWEPHIRNQVGKRRQAHLIHWNLERPAGSAGSVEKYATRQWEQMGAKERFWDEVWVSDQKLATETSLRYVTLGSDEGLGEPSDDKIYDFCHMSAPVPRRTGIYARFNQDKVGSNCWPPERDEVLRKSKFALNVHQDVYSFQEPLRFALFAAYGLPIVSELLAESYPYGPENIITAPYVKLVSVLKDLLDKDYTTYRDMGLKTRELMTKQFRFKNLVEKAVHESIGWR